MPKKLSDVIRDASELSDRDRATLAGVLIESLDQRSEASVESAWEKEIGRRAAEIRDGSVELIPWEVVRDELFDRRDED